MEHAGRCSMNSASVGPRTTNATLPPLVWQSMSTESCGTHVGGHVPPRITEDATSERAHPKSLKDVARGHVHGRELYEMAEAETDFRMLHPSWFRLVWTLRIVLALGSHRVRNLAKPLQFAC